MKLIDLKGFVCDYVNLIWNANGNLIQKEYDEYDLEVMYDNYGHATVEEIWAGCDSDEFSYLVIKVKEPVYKIKDPKDFTIKAVKWNNKHSCEQVSVWYLRVDPRTIEYLIELIPDAAHSNITKYKGRYEWYKRYEMVYEVKP